MPRTRCEPPSSVMWTGGDSVSEDDRTQLEQAITDAQLRPYQAMVIRTIAEGENVTAALRFLEDVREVNGEG
jgi:hypothetical protein